VRDDAQLIEEALRGDAQSFGEWVRKYQDRLFNTVVHVAGQREEAEDVVQEAFVQAFLKLSSFQRQSAFYTWLYRIAFNVAKPPAAPQGRNVDRTTSRGGRRRTDG
jgi:RNA polymerase sigma-70 factor, ECF subfamily